MCTVSFIPLRDGVCITSSRDEKRTRSAALPPAFEEATGGRMLYPRDPDAGGTWIALHANGSAIVLLNGAFHPHIPTPPYRKSRGHIVLDVAREGHPLGALRRIRLSGVEPFTAVIWQEACLYECRWDGAHLHENPKDGDCRHIWSSVTLYHEDAAARRRQWFRDWSRLHPQPCETDIEAFHRTAGDGDAHDALRMERPDACTVSITSVRIGMRTGRMRHHDLLAGGIHEETLALTTAKQKG